ncbi:carbamoyltransferase C-terminal domain-containing protein [Magnetospirillum sp. UT-4]|uniref:carbamoyltransferase family protein n=1 Tax=Magnetospirillum sp. UT-4 TaxID=2681467 RepID=UPI0013813E07|nr:carbamoyltransferase C-terminal domain-containing protein [Magnetospirillum sp. UT-4]CAA7612099.1 putative Nodulation protein NolNO [Magnetospirillum sp. UT-4]
MIVLGLHGGVTVNQHEPAAALAINGRIVALCEEERYLRVKSCYGMLPEHSIRACLKMAGIRWEQVDLVVAPGITYDFFADRIRDYLRHLFGSCPRVELVHHQEAHVAAAFYGSGYDEALCLTLDASGDGACGMIASASKGDGIKVLETIPTARSIGYFYTMMTYYLGFTDGDEYKVMGLAPYGEPSVDVSRIIRPAPGGWDFDPHFLRSDPPTRSPFEPTYSPRLAELLGQPNRTPGTPLTQFHKDVARSTQAAFEECLMTLAAEMKAANSGIGNFCYAGGVALNCAANRRLMYSGLFDNVYVSPVASDRGLALGCAYLGAVMSGDSPWQLWDAYLGSSYSDDDIRKELVANSIPFEEVPDGREAAAEMLAQDMILGWYQGRSEAGARALGNRSIVAPCGDEKMRDKVNARIKYREEFRPFAPSALYEDAEAYFRTDGRDLPTMSFTVDALPGKADGIRAVVHADGTARLQTVKSSTNELYYDLISKYKALSDVPVILNTSFNLKGQPIVETPRDAIMTFFGCGLDALVMGNFVVRKPKP